MIIKFIFHSYPICVNICFHKDIFPQSYIPEVMEKDKQRGPMTDMLRTGRHSEGTAEWS